ncbi:MAG: AMP-binding protein [Muribaculaceae bacterium]
MHSFNTIILSQLISFCNSNHNSFYINEKYYSYKDLALSVSKIRKVLKEKSIMNMHVGLVSNNDIETYAAIIALWLEGDAYIPLHPEMPIERCDDIIEQVEIKYIIDSSAQSRFTNEEIIAPALLQDSYLDLELNEDISDDKFAYILFTSGSTGQPKGVPISRKNVLAFVESFWALGYELSAKDRCLQAFDLTFDLSVISYLIPLLKGACVYPVPYDCIKYAYIAELLEDEELTFALMVPSTIRFLRAYFDEINAPSLKYNLFCGEALPAPLLKEWSRCIPNAFIDNVYGPTENTIFCTRYRYSREHDNKTYNDILSIGKSMNNTSMTLFDDNCNELSIDTIGELCLSGDFLTPGYWENNKKNEESFFTKNGIRYYRTGDMCKCDKDGDFLYIERKDFQAKIQGYRIELGEIEHHATTLLNGANAIAIVFKNNQESDEIALFIDDIDAEVEDVRSYLKSKLPPYMIPNIIHCLQNFPLNNNGKIDRNKLKEIVENG